jgi:hypothetical protein
MKDKAKYFGMITVATIIIVFALNYAHINQQGTVTDVFRPIAENILDGKGYQCAEFGDEALTYPLWGYTLLVAADSLTGTNGLFLLTLQAILCYIGILYFYKLFMIQKRYFHLLLFLPFIAMMSVKWPDAIAGALLIPYAYYGFSYIKTARLKHLIINGLLLGLILNFRSEYLYLPIFTAVLSVLPTFKQYRKPAIISGLVGTALAVLLLIPWIVRSYNITDEIHLSATNGGAVMYISLGQLPDNPWGIVPLDQTAFDFAAAKGLPHPYSAEADKIFKAETKKLILENPGLFIKKCANNLFASLYRGVYTGEFANLAITFDRRLEINQNISSRSGLGSKITALFNLPAEESSAIIAEKIIQALFVPIFFMLLLKFMFLLIKMPSAENKLLMFFLAGIIIYKFLIISAIQYEYRHMNAVYMFLLGTWLMYRRKRTTP